MDMLDNNFDVLILSEIWSHNLDFYHNISDGYSFYFNLPQSTSIGGVGVYIKNELSCKIRSDLQIISTTGNKVENLWCEIIKNKAKYLIGGICRYPNPHVKEFSDLIESKLKIIYKGKTSWRYQY